MPPEGQPGLEQQLRLSCDPQTTCVLRGPENLVQENLGLSGISETLYNGYRDSQELKHPEMEDAASAAQGLGDRQTSTSPVRGCMGRALPHFHLPPKLRVLDGGVGLAGPARGEGGAPW